MSNPWNLSDLQCKVLDALVEHGSEKVAAGAIDVHRNAITGGIRAVKEKMGVSHRVQAILEWDRWKRAAQ